MTPTETANREPKQGQEDESATTCTWVHEGWYDAYETACGGVFYLAAGTPATNRINYCPFCGRPLSTERQGE